jgi:glycosyltransferase involved in cell wall biosynthesis
MVQEEEVGWVVPPDRPQELVRVLREAQDRFSALEQMGIRARKAAEQKYSYFRGMEAYLRLFAATPSSAQS